MGIKQQLTGYVDNMDINIELNYKELQKKLNLIASDQTARQMHEAIGRVILERVKDHLSIASVSRHKVADRLQSRPTRYLEYAAGRTEISDVSATSASITIKNTPGLSRAFEDLTITPKKAKSLTIPLHRISHGKRVADLRASGHKIFKAGNVLAEKQGKNGIRPLYALVRKVVVPKDEGLLPNRSELKAWATEATSDFFESMKILED